MELTKEVLLKLTKELSLDEEIKISEIPCVDLYMDQITTFFDDKLKDLKRDTNDKLLTKTMINNYTKSKLLTPAKGKKYNKNQIILLILIYNLKQVLSINDISLVLNPIIKDLTSGKSAEISLDNIYSSFLDIKNNQLPTIEENFNEKLTLVKERFHSENNKEESISELILMILMLINEANTHKRMAEKIIDTFLNKEK